MRPMKSEPPISVRPVTTAKRTIVGISPHVVMIRRASVRLNGKYFLIIRSEPVEPINAKSIFVTRGKALSLISYKEERT